MSDITFRLPKNFSLHAACWYETPNKLEDEDRMLSTVQSSVKRQQYINKKDLLKLAVWKSHRRKDRLERNTDSEIKEITRIALAAQTERCRIASLLGLDGVSWPIASAILHVCHTDQYPILDARALGTLGYKYIPSYNFSFWTEYVKFCRSEAQKLNTDMRTFDRALWGWSKKHKVIALPHNKA